MLSAPCGSCENSTFADYYPNAHTIREEVAGAAEDSLVEQAAAVLVVFDTAVAADLQTAPSYDIGDSAGIAAGYHQVGWLWLIRRFRRQELVLGADAVAVAVAAGRPP